MILLQTWIKSWFQMFALRLLRLTCFVALPAFGCCLFLILVFPSLLWVCPSICPWVCLFITGYVCESVGCPFLSLVCPSLLWVSPSICPMGVHGVLIGCLFLFLVPQNVGFPYLSLVPQKGESAHCGFVTIPDTLSHTRRVQMMKCKTSHKTLDLFANEFTLNIWINFFLRFLLMLT